MNYEMNHNMELIEKYIDGSLHAAEKHRVEKMIENDPEFREQFECVKLAVASVRLSGLHAQVSQVANQYFTAEENVPAIRPTAKVRSMAYYALRVAAVLIVVLASYTSIMYATVTPESMYAGAFAGYDLPTSRGSAQSTTVEQEYRRERWKEVIDEVSDIAVLSQKDLFLGGMAALQLDKVEAAKAFFSQVIDKNKTRESKPFQEESEFYLALTYLKLNEPQSANVLLTAIRNNPNHMYYSQANEISALKLMLLNWKK